MSKISTGVSKIKEWKGSSLWYKVNCACGNGDCDSLITFEFDEDFGGVDVNFYKTVMWGAYYQKEWWFQRLWLRIKMATQILFKGYTELEGTFLIQDRDHMDDFITALQEGREKMEVFAKEFKKENGKEIEDI